MAKHQIHNDHTRALAIEAIQALDLSKPFVMEIKRRSTRRSLNQNSLFHKHVAEIAAETGNDNDTVKEALKAMFLPPRFVDMAGQSIEVRRSTAALSVAEMAEFMARVQGWAAGEGYALTAPEDIHLEAMR